MEVFESVHFHHFLSLPSAVKIDKKVQREKEEQKEADRIVGCTVIIGNLILASLLGHCAPTHESLEIRLC